MYSKILRHVLFPLFDSVIKQRTTMKHLASYKKNETLTQEQISAIQLTKLKALLRYSNDNVTYYRNLFKRIGLTDIDAQIQSVNDLAMIPVLTKDLIREHKHDLTPNTLKEPNLVKTTGGSTSAPTRIEINPESEWMRNAVMHRGYEWMNAPLGTKTLYLWGANLTSTGTLSKLKHRLHDMFLNRTTLNSFAMTQDNMDEYIKKINRFKPEAIVAYTQPLYTLAQYVLKHEINIHRPKTIITGAEALQEHERRTIEIAFRSPVYNSYGCREVMLIGAECAHHDCFHINTDHLVVETVDENGQQVINHEGDILLTDLSNTGMPLIRYQNGDRGVLSDVACGCKIPFPVLSEVTGRRSDIIHTKEGGIIPGLFFPHLIKDVPNVIKYQIIQSTLDAITLKLVTDGGLNDEQRWFIKDRFGELSKLTTLKIEEVDSIPLTKNGKHRFVLSELN